MLVVGASCSPALDEEGTIESSVSQPALKSDSSTEPPHCMCRLRSEEEEAQAAVVEEVGWEGVRRLGSV